MQVVAAAAAMPPQWVAHTAALRVVPWATPVAAAAVGAAVTVAGGAGGAEAAAAAWAFG